MRAKPIVAFQVLATVLLQILVMPCGRGSTQPGPSIHGIVRDSRGRPLDNAEVILKRDSGAWALTTQTGLFGTFRFEELPPARYRLIVEKAGFVAVTEELWLPAEPERDLEIILTPTSVLVLRERIMVVGDPSALRTIPGSAHYLGRTELEKLKLDFDDIHQLLRQIPGVNIQEEEGYGLRPNIGFRGSGVERSSKITLLEDGIPIAPAIYAAPAAYYFPTAGRMEALEVRKGSSQIKHGPRTNGGALNLISTSIPSQLKATGNLALGEHGSRKLHLNVGDSYRNFGWFVETFQMGNSGFKELDGGGETGFNLQDYLAKFRVNSNRDQGIYQEFEVKLGYTSQLSDETYLGLTDEDFADRPYRRYRASQPDFFEGEHEQYQGRYFLAPSSRFDLTATIYRNNFRRNWYKLQSVLGTGISSIFDDVGASSAELAIVKGADSLPDALRVRANNRKYYSQGVQAIAGLHHGALSAGHRFEFGFRYHRDQEDRFQHEDGFQMVDQRMRLTSRGAPGSQSNRVSDAESWALFVQDTARWGRLTLVPGIRFERIELIRTDFSASDADRRAATRVRRNRLDVVIPGIGAHFELSRNSGVFAGIHRGFSPPGPGSNEDTDAEESINYEFGLRFSGQPAQLELVAFYSDYHNLLGADTLASGGTGEGDFFNGGKARVAGMEVSGSLDIGDAVSLKTALPVQFAYTLTQAEFLSSFDSTFDPWGRVTSGDQIPYIPAHQLYASFGVERGSWLGRVETVYAGQLRTQAGQGPIPAQYGIDSHTVGRCRRELQE